MKYNGAEIIIKLLEKQGITIISGIPGGANLPLYHALGNSKIKHVLARHEQGAGFIAHGIARSTGKPAVCFATSGPGATNLVTSIADAKLDSIPIIAITGQVPSNLIGTDAFQEVDIFGITQSITKHNFLVKKTEELLEIIPKAFQIALSGRPGPVVIDIPKDIQLNKIEIQNWPVINIQKNNYIINNKKIIKIADKINNSKKPILYIGGGIINSRAEKEIYELSNKSNIPVTTTLMGLGAFPGDNDLNIGMLGMHGAKHTNYIINKTDLLLAFGVRFDDRATGKVELFCPDADIIHIDIDDSEINKIKNTHINITADIKTVLQKMLPYLKENKRKEWRTEINTIKKENHKIKNNTNPFNPENFIKMINKITDKNTIITTDVGQHQMWTAQYYNFLKSRKFLTSGGLGTMGFGLPAAIGAAIANPDENVICISGDGSFLMNIQELATLSELNLNIKIFIMNNGYLGLVRQQQEHFYEKKYIASKFQSKPDFAGIAKYFGIKSYDFKNEVNINHKIKIIMDKKGPAVINFPINYKENVLPIVPPGKANHQMIG